MKKSVLAIAVAAGIAMAASAARLEAGGGLANDLATGGNERDVTFVTRGGGNAYGYRSFDTVLGVTVLPWSLPNEESSVYGLRLDFGWGSFVDTYGFAAGAFTVTARDFGGVSATFIGNATGGVMKGVQVGLVNVVQDAAYGVQIGAVNMANDLHGVQIGVLNFNGSGVRCFPILNIGF